MQTSVNNMLNNQVSMNDGVICIQMPVSKHMMAFYYKCVSGEWVRYKREKLGTVH